MTRTVSFKEIPYKPPTGFEVASIDDTPKTSKLFSKSGLEGKQIWYITAPASVPISSIQKVSLAGIKQGEAILSHNGSNYGFQQDASVNSTYTKIVMPNSSDDGYRTGKYCPNDCRYQN
jgi:hypothetical protein